MNGRAPLSAPYVSESLMKPFYRFKYIILQKGVVMAADMHADQMDSPFTGKGNNNILASYRTGSA